MLNLIILAFIWSEQNKNYILQLKHLNIFVKQTNFPELFWPALKNANISKAMYIDSESCFILLLPCQFLSLSLLKNWI